jgi:hypothetical protein
MINQLIITLDDMKFNFEQKKIFLYQAISLIHWVLCLMIYFNRYFILQVSLFCIRIFSGALLKFGESLMACSRKDFKKYKNIIEYKLLYLIWKFAIHWVLRLMQWKESTKYVSLQSDSHFRSTSGVAKAKLVSY